MAIVKFSNKKPGRGRKFFKPSDSIGHFNQWDQFDPRDPKMNPPTFGTHDREQKHSTRATAAQSPPVSETVSDKLSPQHGHPTIDQAQRVSPTLRRSRRGLPQPTAPELRRSRCIIPQPTAPQLGRSRRGLSQPTAPQLRRSQRRLRQLTPPQDNSQEPAPIQPAPPRDNHQPGPLQLAAPLLAAPLLPPPLLPPQNDPPQPGPLQLAAAHNTELPQPSHPELASQLGSQVDDAQLIHPNLDHPQPGPQSREKGNNNTNTTLSAVFQGVKRIKAGKKPMRGEGWTDEEDLLLLQLRAQNVSYDIIATQHIPNHTQKACEVRHTRMKNVLIITADGTTMTAVEAAAAATNGEHGS